MHVRAFLLALSAAAPRAVSPSGPARAAPDLVVDAKQAGRDIPAAWIVRNDGRGDAGPSILKIFVKVRPFDAPTRAALAAGGADPAAVCRPPGRDFFDLVPALRAGEARTVPTPGLFPALGPLPLALRNAGPFVCVYDVRAVADANDDVKESNESNNDAVRVVERRL